MAKERVWIKTYGCKVNQYEGQVLKENLEKEGYSVVSGLEEADRVIVNTCVVTERAEKEGIRFIRKAVAVEKEVLATGCLARLPFLPSAILSERGCKVKKIEEILEDFASPLKSISYFAGHSRAFLKVEDGCDRRCTYCLVSRIRGAVQSKPVEEVLSEIERLADSGYREVVLCGINLGLYGQDQNSDLASLIRRIIDYPTLPGDLRLRLSSLEPDLLTEFLIDLIASQTRMVPHLHLPLQSGSERILKKMGRPYSVGAYLNLIELLRTKIPNLILTTDLMVGFPGETEDDFEETLKVVGKVQFDRVHIFRYSKRPGTPAAEMENQIPEMVKVQRAHLLRNRWRS